MSGTFVTQLRSSRFPIEIAEPGAASITLRVQAAELWDAVRVVALPETPVAEVKQRVVKHMYSATEHADDFILKFRGWEVLDERASLKEAGITNGSILLMTYRRRRPVR